MLLYKWSLFSVPNISQYSSQKGRTAMDQEGFRADVKEVGLQGAL